MTGLTNMSTRYWPYKGPELNPFNFDNLVDLFDERCERFASRPAISESDQTITFSDLDAKSRNIAAYLQSLEGLAQGDRVAIMLNNSVEYAVISWGILRAGMVLVNTNPMYTQRELMHQFSDSGVKVLMTENNCWNKIGPVISDLNIEHVLIEGQRGSTVSEPSSESAKVSGLDVALSFSGDYVKPELVGTSLAALQYTGGTTGLAKGAILTHYSLLVNCFQSWQALAGFREGKEVVIEPLPLYHVYAFAWGLITFLMHGSHLVLIRDPRQTDNMVTAMSRHKLTCFMGLNSLFVNLLQSKDFSSLEFSDFNCTLSGGAPLPIDTARNWEEITGCKIYEGYGLTEASPVVTANSSAANKPGTVGKLVPCTEAKLIDDDGRDCLLDEHGELCIRGPQIMQGYWQQPNETKEVLSEDGWLRTGDIASIDEEGFISIVDRKKNLVIVSGFNVYPTEIEDVVSNHPGVLECAVIGVADVKSGQSVKLFVVPKSEDINESDLNKYCRDNLTGYKVPKIIEFKESLPKSPVGKVLHRLLK